MYRSEDIRKAMQMLADDRGRLHFEKVVIDDVVKAYRNGSDTLSLHHHSPTQ